MSRRPGRLVFYNRIARFPRCGSGGELEFVDVSNAHPPGLLAGAKLLEAKLYAVIEMIAAHAFRASSAGGTCDLHPVRGPHPRRGSPATSRRQDARHRFEHLRLSRQLPG
jgi:hypothetical protein